MPRVRIYVIFEEVVEAAISANLTSISALFLLVIVRLGTGYAGRYMPRTSSSDPTRRLAPWALASNMLALMRTKLPSQSSAHWFSEHDAIVTCEDMVAKNKSEED